LGARANLANDQVYDADCEDTNDEDSDQYDNACLNKVDQEDIDGGDPGKDEGISLVNTRTDSLPNPATPVQAQHRSLALNDLNTENKPDKHIGQRGAGYDDHGYAHGYPNSEDEHRSSQTGDLSPSEHSSHPSRSGDNSNAPGPELDDNDGLDAFFEREPLSDVDWEDDKEARTTERATAKATTRR
jgi:hypothetical protein